MPIPPEILKRETPAHSRLFRIEALQLKFSNGEVRDYERLLGSRPAVLIVPILDGDKVIMVREYGAGVERYDLTLPKGKVDTGETFEEAANRELQEEAGYAAGSLRLLKQMSQSPSYMQHSTQIVLAQDLSPNWLEGDEPEPLGVEIYPLRDVGALVAREDVTEARTIAALFLVRELLLG